MNDEPDDGSRWLDLELSQSQGQREQFAVLLRLLRTDRGAPTSARAGERAASVHLADSLAALELDVVRGAGQIADVGAGAGFPGLALAVALPKCEVRLVESRRRACEFLRRACAAAQIENARVVCARAEAWSAGMANNDAVVARAVASQPVVLEYAAPLLRVGGALVDWRGRRAPAEERAADVAAAELGMRRAELRRVQPFEGALERHLHTFVKIRATPGRFPRRPGVARKRPLGA
ncbi:MAG: 16S rRNA (guanine(527)-N(7))-methyltransferase RsmG [Actinobacteria bacterium]|nr:MAG: 16S rRNA (guanine(527)-N(7))-methyltransferase RsmG [Actinomycetota bacterium]